MGAPQGAIAMGGGGGGGGGMGGMMPPPGGGPPPSTFFLLFFLPLFSLLLLTELIAKSCCVVRFAGPPMAGFPGSPAAPAPGGYGSPFPPAPGGPPPLRFAPSGPTVNGGAVPAPPPGKEAHLLPTISCSSFSGKKLMNFFVLGTFNKVSDLHQECQLLHSLLHLN